MLYPHLKTHLFGHYLLILLIAISSAVYGQNSAPDTLAALFHRQLEIFPQEKIYLHIDKPHYISGEKIWFRAYMADAATHLPVLMSRYLYVELINPLDSIVTRVKIRPDEYDAHHGHLPIPDDAPGGNYTLRAYTAFMLNQEEDYLFTKTIQISDPLIRTIHTETTFSFESAQRVRASLQFSYAENSNPFIPQSVKVKINEGRALNLNVDNSGRAEVNFNLPATSPKRVMLLEMVVGKNSCRQFIQIPTPEDDFDLSFYPEGGAIMQGAICKVAFKAMKSNGQAIEVSGTVYDQSGTKVAIFESKHLGMGNFSFLAQKGTSYYAVCENNHGVSKRFDLPNAVDHGYALTVSRMKDHLYVSVQKPAETIQNETLYLLTHIRGVVCSINLWNNDKNLAIIPTEPYPSGVLHLVLFDTGFNPVSERLVFINNPDQATVTYRPDKTRYAARSLVSNQVTLTDNDGEPLIGNFSVAVTADKEVTPDSTSNIGTHLLLTSDLRGYIQDPASYFLNTPKSAQALDLLMCTQGWRRYNITKLAQGDLSRPTLPLEAGSEISGSVQSLLLGKPVEKVAVNVIALNGNYFNSTQTDKNGRFYLSGNELPDSTRFLVSVIPKKGMTRLDLILDNEPLPPRTLPTIPLAKIDTKQLSQYADKAEQQYINDGGIRITLLPEAVVTAQRKPLKKSPYYSIGTMTTISITEEQIERSFATDIFQLLRRIPGVYISGTQITIRGKGSFYGSTDPLIVLNNIPVDNSILSDINVHEIAQIDVLKGAEASFFGVRGANGVISIFTKDGSNMNRITSQPFHIKALLPLGYQQPVAFYAPKYETDTQRNSLKPDLRTTIHWLPVVQTDHSGMASFEFYTADEQTSYTITIQGLTDDGTIVWKEEKVWRWSD